MTKPTRFLVRTILSIEYIVLQGMSIGGGLKSRSAIRSQRLDIISNSAIRYNGC
jgi:hypothetical protein